MRRATIYARLSKDSTGDAAGVTRQLEDCRALAQARGLTITNEHVDNDLSAAGKRRRPGFEALIAEVESGQAQVVVAWAYDRLARNRRDELRLIEAGQKAGITLALVRGSDLDLGTAAGRLTADVLASVARHEIEMKSERQRRANEQAAAEGRRSGGRRPFGYTADMHPIEPEAAAVRDGYRMLVEGRSLADIAREWNRRGLSTPQPAADGTPRPWQRPQMRRCLAKPTYAGLRSHRGRIVGPAKWPALVEEDVWHAAQAVLNDPDRRTGSGARSLLTGVARCGVCGHTVHSGAGVVAARGYRLYRCAGSTGHISRKADPIDAVITEVVVGRLSRPDAVELLSDAAKPDTAALARESIVLRERLDGAAAEYAEGIITISQMRTITTRVRRRLSETEQAMSRAHGGDALAPLLTAQDVRKAWEGLDQDVQRTVIKLLIEITLMPVGRGRWRFDPASVKVEWRSS